jgi:succinate-semialdehyde dehydrogenase/glutarate-semialdehyde dehydrogenase
MLNSHLLPNLPTAGLAVTNPFDGALLAYVADCCEDETVAAVEKARAAMAVETPLETRAGWLAGIVHGLKTEREEMARIITLEQGKPLKEARTEVDYAAGFFGYFAANIDRLAPRTLDERPGGLTWTIHQRPAGVAALITPWNFPLAMLAKKLAGALAGGCASVTKPSELTPLSALALRQIALRAGVPDGFVQVVTGIPDLIGGVFCTHPDIRVVSCTSSTATGKRLLASTAPYVKRLALELGGNAPFIVFAYTDVALAADALIANKFRCAGQTCVCTNRVYVDSLVHDRFVEAVAEGCAKLVVGDGSVDGTDIGPLINRTQWDRVDAHVTDALAKGAKRIFGQVPLTPIGDHGCFYPPTILTGCDETMLAFREETFGPIISVARFSDEADVLSRANGTPYGLAAYVFTPDASQAARATAALRFGHIAVNSGAGPTPEAPFGGIKESGLGREGGWEGLAEYVEPQTVARR